jgi:hypothetical protein
VHEDSFWIRVSKLQYSGGSKSLCDRVMVRVV